MYFNANFPTFHWATEYLQVRQMDQECRDGIECVWSLMLCKFLNSVLRVSQVAWECGNYVIGIYALLCKFNNQCNMRDQVNRWTGGMRYESVLQAPEHVHWNENSLHHHIHASGTRMWQNSLNLRIDGITWRMKWNMLSKYFSTNSCFHTRWIRNVNVGL